VSRIKVLVYRTRRFEEIVRKAVDILRELNVEFDLIDELPSTGAESCDFVLTLGDDRSVLETLHQTVDSGLPVLGVNEMDGGSFLTEVGLSGLRQAVRSIARGRYNVEEALTLRVRVDRRDAPPAVNEAAVFPYRSATLLKYTLIVDGEEVWTDSSDGVIVATPIGSTAYAMSAGGPMVLPRAKVFAVVSVNSLDVTRRPLIVPEYSTVKIDNIASRHYCELIVDGIYRSRIGRTVEVTRSGRSARLIRLPKTSPTAEKITKKVLVAKELISIPPSAKLILKTLEYEGPLERKELLKKTMLPERTASLALSILLERGLVRRRSSLRDVRKKIYYAV